MFSPHLPAPSSNVERHRLWERIKFILLVSFLAIWAGGAAAIFVIGWLWPVSGGGDTWAISYSQSKAVRDELETAVRDSLKNQVVTIYSKTERFDDYLMYATSKNKLGEAVVFSNDGWLAMYASPNLKTEIIKDLVVVMADGKTERIEKVVKDPYSPFVYLKATASTSAIVWRPAEFDDGIVGEEVFIMNTSDGSQMRSWYPTYIEQSYFYPAEQGHLDIVYKHRFQMSRPTTPGSITVSKQGRIVGFGDEGGYMIPGSIVSRQLSPILAGQTVSYPTLGVEGWFSQEQPIIFNHKVIAGFLVTKNAVKNSALQKGDIILEVNGQIVDPVKMWYTMGINKELRLSILRSGKRMDVRVPVSVISPVSNP
jgi:hypothetical protein